MGGSADLDLPSVVSLPLGSANPLPLSARPYLIVIPDNLASASPASSVYLSVSAVEIVLTPRLLGPGPVPRVRLLLGPGDVLPIDGRLWGSVYYALPVPAPQPSADHVTIAYPSSVIGAGAPVIMPTGLYGETPKRRPRRMTMTVTYNAVLPANALSWSDTLTVPGGQRWRLRAAGVRGVFAANTAGSVVTISCQRLATYLDVPVVLIATGTQTTAGTYAAISDEIVTIGTTGASGITLRPGPYLTPGDTLTIVVNALTGDTVQLAIVLDLESDS